jgi:hypothetical protein
MFFIIYILIVLLQDNMNLKKESMMSKTIPVKPHDRSKPGSPPYKGPGNKPGPKPVHVEPYKRNPPSK